MKANLYPTEQIGYGEAMSSLIEAVGTRGEGRLVSISYYCAIRYLSSVPLRYGFFVVSTNRSISIIYAMAFAAL